MIKRYKRIYWNVFNRADDKILANSHDKIWLFSRDLMVRPPAEIRHTMVVEIKEGFE